MSHGAIFTSQAWSQPKVESIGNRGEDGIRVTYSLDCMKDDVLSYMGPGKIDAVYTLVKGKNGETIFDSDIKITTENELQPVYIGALAQHSFFKTTKNDIMQTSAPDEVKAQEDRPELPTGKIGAVTKENDFNKARKVHDGKNREVVLTGYEKTEDKRPKATLHRDGLKIEIEAGGVIGDVHGFDGFLLCNKTNGATDRVMLEPIARYPNIMNVPHKSKNPMKPIIVTKDEPFRAHSRITAMAV
jgi:galactose mutarotase-like enzyme